MRCRQIKGFCPATLGQVNCTLGNRAAQPLIICSVHYGVSYWILGKIFVREYITGSILQLSVSCVNIWVYSKTNFYKHSQGYWACWELPDNQYSSKICTLYLIRYYVMVTGLRWQCMISHTQCRFPMLFSNKNSACGS